MITINLLGNHCCLFVVCICLVIVGRTNAEDLTAPDDTAKLTGDGADPTASDGTARLTEDGRGKRALIRAYSINHAHGDQIASLLRTMYPHREDARISFYKINQLLIVLGSDHYQNQIRELFPYWIHLTKQSSK